MMSDCANQSEQNHHICNIQYAMYNIQCNMHEDRISLSQHKCTTNTCERQANLLLPIINPANVSEPPA